MATKCGPLNERGKWISLWLVSAFSKACPIFSRISRTRSIFIVSSLESLRCHINRNKLAKSISWYLYAILYGAGASSIGGKIHQRYSERCVSVEY